MNLRLGADGTVQCLFSKPYHTKRIWLYHDVNRTPLTFSTVARVILPLFTPRVSFWIRVPPPHLLICSVYLTLFVTSMLFFSLSYHALLLVWSRVLAGYSLKLMPQSFKIQQMLNRVLLRDEYSCSQSLNLLEPEDWHQLCAHCLRHPLQWLQWWRYWHCTFGLQADSDLNSPV